MNFTLLYTQELLKPMKSKTLLWHNIISYYFSLQYTMLPWAAILFMTLSFVLIDWLSFEILSLCKLELPIKYYSEDSEHIRATIKLPFLGFRHSGTLTCYVPNVCVLPKILKLKHNPQGNGIKWELWVVIRSWQICPHEWDACPHKKGWRELVRPFSQVKSLL